MNSLTTYCGKNWTVSNTIANCRSFRRGKFGSTSGRYSAKPLPTLKGFYALPLLPHLVPNTAE